MGNSIPVYLVGEGPSELGRSSAKDGEPVHDGFLQIVLRKTFEAQGRQDQDIAVVGAKLWKDLRLHGRGRGASRRQSTVTTRLAQAALLAKQKHAKALLFLVDDKKGKISGDLRMELPEVRSDYSPLGIAAGTAIQELEVVLIADQEGCRRAFEDFVVHVGPKPEDVGNPKAVFSSAFSTYRAAQSSRVDRGLSWRQARYRVFDELNLETLRKRCPRGIGVFLEELDAVVAALEAGA